MPANNQVIQVVLDFITAETESECQQLLDAHCDLLMSDVANQLFADWLEESKDNSEARRILERRLALLAFEYEQVVQRFVRADSWEARKELILAKSKFLLSDAAKKVLADLIELERGKRKSRIDIIHTLQECRACLVCCRQIRIDVACQIIEVMSVWLKRDCSLTEWLKIASPQSELLLSDVADQALTILLEQYEDDSDITYSLLGIRMWLTCCRRTEVDLAMAGKITVELDSFVNIDEVKLKPRPIKSQRSVLLTDTTERFLANWIELGKSIGINDEIIHELQECQALLAAGRRKEKLNQLVAGNPELWPLRDEIMYLGSTPAILALLGGDSSRQAVASLVLEYPELLFDEVETFLLQWIHKAQAQNNDALKAIARKFEKSRPILRDLREEMEKLGFSEILKMGLMPEGMRLVMQEILNSSNNLSPALFNTIWKLIFYIPYGAEAHAYIKAHPELLTDEADDILALILELDSDLTTLFQVYRDLLASCREQGIEPAFAFTDSILNLLGQLLNGSSDEEWYELPAEHPDLERFMRLVNSPSKEELATKYPELVLGWQMFWAHLFKSTSPENVIAILDLLEDDGFEAVLDIVETYPQLVSNEINALLLQWIDKVHTQGHPLEKLIVDEIEIRYKALRQLRELMAKTGFSVTQAVLVLRIMQNASDDYSKVVVEAISKLITTIAYGATASAYIEAHSELQSDEVEHIFAFMLSASKDDPDIILFFQAYRHLLARCRQEGIEAAFTEPTPDLLVQRLVEHLEEELLTEHPELLLVFHGVFANLLKSISPRNLIIIRALLGYEGLEGISSHLEQYPELLSELLSDEIDTFLVEWINKLQTQDSAESQELTKKLEKIQASLRLIQEEMAKEGVSASELEWGLRLRGQVIRSNVSLTLFDTIIGLLFFTPFNEVYDYFEAHDELLSDEADHIFAIILEHSQEHPEFALIVEAYRKLLANHREKGRLTMADRSGSQTPDLLDKSSEKERHQYLTENQALAFVVYNLSIHLLREAMTEWGLTLGKAKESLPFVIKVTMGNRETVKETLEAWWRSFAEFANSSNKDAARAYLQAHTELLSDEAINGLTLAFEIMKNNPDMARFAPVLPGFLDLLTRCRQEGIDAVFADYQHPLTVKQWTQISMADSEDKRIQSIAKQPELRWQLRALREQDPQLTALMDKAESPQAFAIQMFKLFEEEPKQATQMVWSLFSLFVSGEQTGFDEQKVDFIEKMTSLIRIQPNTLNLWLNLFNSAESCSEAFVLLLEASLLQSYDRPSDIPRIIEVCQEALALVERDVHSELWASFQFLLAYSYYQNTEGDYAENIEQVIYHCEQALELLEAYPLMWAGAHDLLAKAYFKRKKGERAENIEKEISHYGLALEVFTRQDFPEEWAEYHRKLGEAYLELATGGRAKNIEQAIWHFRQSLEVSGVVLQNRRYAAYRLGVTLYEEGRLAEARQALEVAHEAVESLRSEAQQDAAKRDLSEQNADLYAHLVACCLHEADEAAAFRFAVAGKGRAFVDMLASTSTRVDFWHVDADRLAFAADWQKQRCLRQQIDHLELKDESSQDLKFLQLLLEPVPTLSAVDLFDDQLADLREEAAARWEEMVVKYPKLMATQQAPPLSVEQARTLSAELGATLVEYYRHANGWCAFVVTPDKVQYVPLPEVNDELLKQMQEWIEEIEEFEGSCPLSYSEWPKWYEALMAPLREYFRLGGSVVLAPFDTLHLLPLAALRHPISERYLVQDYTLAFAPNLGALRYAHKRAGEKSDKPVPQLQKLLSVAYPSTPDSDDYLPNVVEEAVAIAKYFSEVESLHESAATPEAVIEHAPCQEVVHFGCHGRFDTKRPNESGLMLARDPEGVPEELTLGPAEWLTVQDIIVRLDFSQNHLVTLGACQSGQTALRSGDEHVGLTQAIMIAGAPTVVSSLWKVDDETTRALFEAFYAGVRANQSPASALRQAQELVRNQSDWEDPYFWAAFTVSGVALANQEPQMTWPADLLQRLPLMSQNSKQRSRAMNSQNMLKKAEILLKKIIKYPDRILSALTPVEKALVIDTLQAQAEKSKNVQTEADLLAIAHRILFLVEETEGLKEQLLPRNYNMAKTRRQRAVTMKNHQATSKKDASAQANAPQMGNLLSQAGQELEKRVPQLSELRASDEYRRKREPS